MQPSYWRRQEPNKPLFPDTAWSKPEQRSQAGKLGIIGGNKLGFLGVAEAYTETTRAGVGSVRALLPADLRKLIPATITDTVYAPTNHAGSLSADAETDMRALGAWADGILLIGDSGRSSETAILYEKFIREYDGQLIITRDAIDLMKNSYETLVDRDETTLIMSFAQLQKLFQSLYYPIVLTFSMQLSSLVDALHKFTITYPLAIVVLHKDHILVAQGGEVVTQSWDSPMAIWRGQTAARASAWLLWNKARPLEAITTSLLSSA